MDKRKTLIIIIVIVFVIINLIFIAYLIDSQRIVTQADIESTVSATDLSNLPSPDQSIITRFFSKLLEPFIK